MLVKLSTGVRFRLAIALAAFAAVCFALPPGVLAFGHGANTIACMSHADAVNHGMAGGHDMAKAGAHKDGGDHKLPAHDHSCCGLFCLSAVVASTAADERPLLGIPHIFAPAPRLLSRMPQLPERPPNALLSA